MSVSRIRKGDEVAVMRGEERGRTGKVIEVLTEKGRARVEGVRMQKSVRKTQEKPKGTFVEREGAVSLAALLPYCPACKKGVRVATRAAEKRKIRVCRKCGHAFDR